MGELAIICFMILIWYAACGFIDLVTNIAQFIIDKIKEGRL
jgi:hypothetical protein